MAAPVIILEVEGQAPGVPGQSRVFEYSVISTPPLVEAKLSSYVGVESVHWEFLDVPKGASVVFDDPTAFEARFTPTEGVTGTYLVQCTLNEGESRGKIGLAFLTQRLGLRKIAAGEGPDFDAKKGWAAAYNDLADKIEGAESAPGSVIVELGDTVAEPLASKLVAGTGVTLDVLTDLGGAKTLRVNSAGGWKPPDNFVVSPDIFAFTLPNDKGFITATADEEDSQVGIAVTDPNTGAVAFLACAVSDGKSQALALTDHGGFNFYEGGAIISTPNNLPGYHVDDEDNPVLTTTAQTLVGAINELHRPVEVIYAELSPDGNSPASTDYALQAGWYICSFVKAEKISGDCSKVTVRLLDGVEEIYKHAGPGGAGNDLDAEAMQDRNVFSMETVGSMLTIEVDSPAACVVRITLRVRAE